MSLFRRLSKEKPIFTDVLYLKAPNKFLVTKFYCIIQFCKKTIEFIRRKFRVEIFVLFMTKWPMCQRKLSNHLRSQNGNFYMFYSIHH